MDSNNNQRPSGPPKPKNSGTLDLRNIQKQPSTPPQRPTTPRPQPRPQPTPQPKPYSPPTPTPHKTTSQSPTQPRVNNKPTSATLTKPTQTAKNKSKPNLKIMVIISSIIILGVIAVVAYLIYTNANSTTNTSSNTSSSTNSNSTYPAATDYTPKLAAQFNQVVNTNCYSTKIFEVLNLTQKGCSIHANHPSYNFYEVRVTALSENTTAKEGIKKISAPPPELASTFKIISEQEFSLDGYPAIKQTYSKDAEGTMRVSVLSESPQYEVSGIPTKLFLIDGAYYHNPEARENFDTMMQNWKWKK